MYIGTILNNSTAVRTLVHPSVRTCISQITPDYDSVIDYKTNIKDWLKPIVDLKDFYVYPMNGITEGLNWWLGQEENGIIVDKGDYQWVKPKFGGDSRIHYISIPSAIDGNFRDIPDTIKIALDLAYVGSTIPKKIDLPSNVNYVFYSLSKSFGIRNVRTGWLFTKHEQPKLEALVYGAKYYNYYAHSVSECIIDNFDIDFVHKEYYNKQKEVCSKLDLTPSDSVWIATSKDPMYEKFRRTSNIARLCLAGVYNE